MFDNSAAQARMDLATQARGSAGPDADMSDSDLLEDALLQAIDAHAAGLLAAPFGVDAMALVRARRRALRSDLKQLVARSEPNGLRADSA